LPFGKRNITGAGTGVRYVPNYDVRCTYAADTSLKLLMTCGPWKPIRVETYNGRLADVWIEVNVDENLRTASITANAQIEGSHGGKVSFTLSLDGKCLSESVVEVGKDHFVKTEFNLNTPVLWYPHGYGAQPLYEVSASLLAGDASLHRVSKNFGVRRAELIQQADKHGKSFYFRINNVDVFCGGSDWIPADSFTPRISDDKYRRWLELMVDGNQCMIRVWGGGIWEADIFYSTCDELGIMVWQDFMFGIYMFLLLWSSSDRYDAVSDHLQAAVIIQHIQKYSNQLKPNAKPSSSDFDITLRLLYMLATTRTINVRSKMA